MGHLKVLTPHRFFHPPFSILHHPHSSSNFILTGYLPLDLAKDKSIDLVVCSTRVDRHFSTVRSSIIAGKDVFVEWPLEKNLAIVKEMNELAKKHGGRTIVGLQGRYSEPVVKIKSLVDGGRIGKVLGSTLFAALGVSGLSFLSPGVRLSVQSAKWYEGSEMRDFTIRVMVCNFNF